MESESIAMKYTGLLDNVIADYTVYRDGSLLFESYWRGKKGNIQRVGTNKLTREDLSNMGFNNPSHFIANKKIKYKVFRETSRLSCYPFSLENPVVSTEFARNELNLIVEGIIEKLKKFHGRQLARVRSGDTTVWIDIRYLKYAC